MQMVDVTLFEDRTLKRLIVGIAAGLALGMILDIVLVVFRGSAYLPVIFVLVLVAVLALLVRWSEGLQ
jgi:hypothetical protein